jgi:hypothetical protein
MSTIAFTGTRLGLNARQQLALESVFVVFNTTGQPQLKAALHGDAVGADVQFAAVAKRFRYLVFGYPVEGRDSDRGHFPNDETRMQTSGGYLARNRLLVDSCDILIAAPPCDEPQEKGGTWYTIKYASKVAKPVIMLWRDLVV